MSKTTIEQKAKKYLKENKIPQIYATSDGFLFTHQPDAINHGRTLDKKDVQTFKNGSSEPETAKKSPFLDQSIKDMKAALPEKKDVAELEAYLEEEKAQEDPRAGAIEAIEAAIEELTKDKD